MSKIYTLILQLLSNSFTCENILETFSCNIWMEVFCMKIAPSHVFFNFFSLLTQKSSHPTTFESDGQGYDCWSCFISHVLQHFSLGSAYFGFLVWPTVLPTTHQLSSCIITERIYHFMSRQRKPQIVLYKLLFGV